MALRMLRYYTDIRFAEHQGPIRQFLVYIGGDALTMPAGIDEPELLDYRYGLVDMHRVTRLDSSEVAELLGLSVERVEHIAAGKE